MCVTECAGHASLGMAGDGILEAIGAGSFGDEVDAQAGRITVGSGAIADLDLLA